MSKWWMRAVVLVLVLVGVWWLKSRFFEKKPIPVTVIEVDRGQVEAIATNSRAGTVRARRRARLSPEIGGQVIALPFLEGDRVHKGDVVLQLAPTSQNARVLLAERDLDAARAEARRACLAAERSEREFNNAKRLTEDLILPADQLDQADSTRRVAEAACESSRAQVARARANIVLALTELGKTEIRSPFDGIVADVATEVGEWATPSPPALPVPPIIDVFDPASIYVSAPMDEVDSAAITVGQRARVTIDSHRNEVFAGEVVRVASFVVDIEAQNRTLDIEVDLDDRLLAESLLPGTSADVEVVLEARERTLRVPTRALIDGNRVLLLVDGILEERTVETGLRNWQFTEVVSGLESGEQLVTSLDRPDLDPGSQAVVESSP